MSCPLFSCVVPVKGPRPYMDEALASLRNQGVGDDLEIIIQDADIEPDGGQADALNKGFAKAQGEWLFWLNADDVLLSGALQKVKAVIHSTTTTPRMAPAAQLASLGGYSNYDSLSWIVGNTVRIDEGGRIISCVRGSGWHDWLYHHAVPHVYGPSAFFRRELFERVGGFDASLDVCMDWDLWIRFMKAGARFRRIGDYCWGLRQWTQSKTQRTLDERTAQRHADEVSRMLAKNELVPTVMGTLTNRVWRLLDGAFVRSWIDTLRLKGRMI